MQRGRKPDDRILLVLDLDETLIHGDCASLWATHMADIQWVDRDSFLAREQELAPLDQALRYLHRPPPDADLDELAEGRHWAQHRLAFEELLTHQLSMQRLRDSLRNQHAPALPKAQRLPAQYLITPDELERKALLQGIQTAVANGVRLIQLRAPNMYSPEYRDLAVDVVGLCAGKAQLMLKGPLEWLGDFPAAGWHLTAEQLRKYAARGRPFPEDRWLAASCHNAEELTLAMQMGVDFVTLSPVQATQTHPEAVPLGWEQVSELIEGFNYRNRIIWTMDCF